MKLILVNQRYGHTRTIVIRGWMKGFLSLCLMGAPVALGYLGYELAFADAGSSSLVTQESAVAPDEFIRGGQPVVLVDQGSDVSDRYAADLASDSLSDLRPMVASVSSLIATPHIEAITAHSPGQLASFQHGRIVDPASYVRRTLH